MNDFLNMIENMPLILSGTELASAMTVLPKYDETIRNENQAVRLIALSVTYTVFICLRQ